MKFDYYRKPNYYETDQMAIVHHSNYIRWFEEARIAFMNYYGFKLIDLESKDVQIPVLEVNAKYIKTVKFGDEVRIEITLTEFTGVRMNFSYKIFNGEEELCNEGYSKHCFIRPKGKAVNLKKVLPDIFAKFQGQISQNT